VHRRVWRWGGGTAAERRPFEVRSQEIEVRSQEIEARSQEIEVRSHDIEVRSQEIEVGVCSRDEEVVEWIGALWRLVRSDSSWM
jgi:hypothetical protein